MEKPYIGITGFTSKNEATEALSAMPCSVDRYLMVGVLASSKTLRGEKNKYPNRYPAVEKITGIFPDDPRALNLIHYSTDDPATLSKQMLELASLAGPNLHGFQLNCAWPPPSELQLFCNAYPETKVVLQIGERSLEMVGNSSYGLSIKLHMEYKGLIDYVLLDSSGGRGQILEVEKMSKYLYVLQTLPTQIGLGIAGGLSPQSLPLIEPFIRDFPDLSIDAEGCLRDGSDKLDIITVKEYIREAWKIFSDLQE